MAGRLPALSRWRYIAQRATTGQFLHYDVPIAVDTLQWVLSGPGSLTGSLGPNAGTLVAADGLPLLDEWGTLLYAEAGGIIRWGGIVLRSQLDGPRWTVEAAGFSTYPHGLPYGGNLSSVSIDPLDAVRAIWSYVQSNDDADLGVQVDGTTTPVRLGKAGEKPYQEVQINGVWVPKATAPAAEIEPSAKAKLKTGIDKTTTTITLLTLEKFGALQVPYFATIGDETIWVLGRDGLTLIVQRGYGASEATGHNAGTYVRHEGTPERTAPAVDPEPYALSWWEAVDCGSEIDKLAQETPFDYAEEHAWSGDQITHRLRIGYPRLGRRRDDLAFEQGVNITKPVVVTRSGDEFANAVHGLGAGEGRRTVVTDVAERDGRLRRTLVYSDKSITRTDRLTAVARSELAARRRTVEISSVDVLDHPHAPIGSWALGDDVLIRARVPWAGDVALWHRVVGWSLLSDTRAQLTLRRSDAFTYRGGTGL